jgi:hypothetical protein
LTHVYREKVILYFVKAKLERTGREFSEELTNFDPSIVGNTVNKSLRQSNMRELILRVCALLCRDSIAALATTSSGIVRFVWQLF